MAINSYCGLDCTKCPTYQASRTGDRALQEKTAREWSQLFSAYTGRNDLRADEMVCDGCKAAEDRVFLGCRVCNMRGCARSKQFDTCAECGEFETCAILNGFFTQAPEAKSALQALRK
jgi:hypothetical protein